MQRLSFSLYAMLLMSLVPLFACDAQGTPQFTFSPEQAQDLATIAAQAGVEMPDPTAVAPLIESSPAALKHAGTGQPPASAGSGGTPTPTSEAVSPGPTIPAARPAGSPETDRDALLAIYEMNGPSWLRNDNWATDAPLGEWYGVTTDANGRVVELDLDSNGLVGQLPPELTNLTELRVLNLSNNAGFWENRWFLPDSLHRLSQLEVLDLGSNYIGGVLYPELGSLSRLRVLDLESHQLRGQIPHEFGNMVSLEELNLVYHGKGGGLGGEFPPSIGDLPNLKRVWVAKNSFAGCIPESLRGRAVREVSYVGGLLNPLKPPYCVSPDDTEGPGSSVQTDINALIAIGEKLPELGWVFNKPIGELWGVDTDANGRVIKLSLSSKKLRGEVPAEIGNLDRLEALTFEGSYFTGRIPPELGQLSRLEYLKLDPFIIDYRFSGRIPAELGNLSNLIWLQIGTDADQTGMPTELGKLTNLEWLICRNCRLGGEIPAEIGNLSWLELLELKGNLFTGEVPPEIGNLSKVVSISLGSNSLTGLPPEIGNLEKLATLTLHSNELTTLPKEIGNLSSLLHLQVDRNKLTSLPEELGNMTKLKHLRLDSYGSLGCIPEFLENHPNASDFNFGDLWFCSIAGRPGQTSGGADAAPAPTPPPVTPEPTPAPPHLSSTPTPGSSAQGSSPCDGIGGRYDWTARECAIAQGIIRDRNGLSAIHGATDEHTDWEAIVAKFNEGKSPDDAGYCYFPANYSLSLDKWCGVTTNDDGRVRWLHLRGIGAVDGEGWGIGLNGTIPSALAGLDALEELNLSGGKVCGLFGCSGGLTGRIPDELGLLPELASVNLSGNELEGSIYGMSCLPNLTRLNLSNNRFRYGATKFLTNPCNVENSELTTEIQLGRNPWTGEPEKVREAISDDDEVITIQRGFIDLTKSTAGRLGVPTDVQGWAQDYVRSQSIELIAYGRHVKFRNRGATFVVRFAGEAARAYTKVIPVVGWVSFGADTAFTLYDVTRATVELLEGVREAREVQSKRFLGTYALCEHDYGWTAETRPDYADELLRDRCE